MAAGGFNGQGGFNPPPWQQGYNNGPRGSGPPPPKRAKSGPGPIITRYPPPPGYTGPARPPAWQHAQQWQPPPQQFNYGQQTAYPGFPNQGFANQGYGASQYNPTPHRSSYPGAGLPTPANTYPQHNSFQAPGTGYYPPTTGVAAAQLGYPPSTGAMTGQYGYPPSTAPTTGQHGYGAPQQYQPAPGKSKYAHLMRPPPPQSPSPPPPPPPSYGPTPPWLQPGAASHNPQERGIFYQRVTNYALDGNGEPLSPDNGPKYFDPNDIESDYFGAERHYAKHPEEIDPDLSLGEIVTQYALPSRRPLPATFNEVEIEAIAPRNPQPDDLESISDYWTNARAHESMLDVRQTDAWQHVRHDPIFREFPAEAAHYTSPQEMAAKYRDRPDPTWNEGGNYTPSPSPEPAPRRRRSGPSHEEEDEPSNFEPPPTGSGMDLEQEKALARLGFVSGAPKPVPARPGANGVSPPQDRKRSRDDDGGGAGGEGDGGAEDEPGRPSKLPRFESD